MASKAIEFGEKTQNKGYYAVQGHARSFKVIVVGIIFEDLGATHDDHLRLIGKRVVDFLLVLIELFSLGVTAEGIRANIFSKSAISFQRGPLDPKFQAEGVAPQPFFFS